MDLQIISKIPYFLFCGYSKRDDVGDKIQKILVLGGCCEYSKRFSASCSHIICKKPVPNEIFLSACLTGKWILVPKYIQDCFEQRCWLEEEAYEWESRFMTDYSSSFEMKLYDAPKQYRKMVTQDGCEIFKGWKVIVLIDDKMKSNKYSRLLELGKAEVVSPYKICKPSVNTTLTHIFFESFNFEPLCLIEERVQVLRPEFVDNYIIEVNSPSIQLFRITLPAASSCSQAINYCTNRGILSANSRTLSPGNTTLSLAESGSTGIEKNDTTNTQRKVFYGDAQCSQSESKNICYPVTPPVCGGEDSSSDTICHLHKRFKPDIQAIKMSTPKRKCIFEDEAINDTSCSTPHKAPLASEMELDTCDIETIPFENTGKIDDSDGFSSGSSGRLLNTKSGNNNCSSFPADDDETCSSLSDFELPRKQLKSKSDTNVTGFNKTSKLGNEKVTKRMQCKFQTVITSYLENSRKECYTKLASNSGQSKDNENSKNSSMCQNYCKQLNASVDFVPVSSSSSNCSTVLNGIDVEEDKDSRVPVNQNDNMKNKIDSHQRYCNVTSSLKIDNHRVQDCPPGAFDDLLDVGLEEEDLWSVLSTAESLVSPSYYPHPHILNSLMFRVLNCSFDENISSRAFVILHRILHLHPPSNNKLGEYYLSAFSLCGKAVVSPWVVLSEVIRNCVQHKASSTRNTQGPEYLLSFIVDVIEYNFNDFKFRNKFPRKLLLEKTGLLPIAVKIFWPTSSECPGTMNRECKELFHHIFQLLDCTIKPKHMFNILLSLQKLLGVIAECLVLIDPGTHSNMYNRPSAHSMATTLMTTIQEPLRNSNTLLQLFLDTIQSIWLRLLFCQKFLDQCTSSSYSVSSYYNCLTLGKILKDYMQREPPKDKYRLRNHSPKIKKPKQPPDKTMKYDDSRHQRSGECQSDINKRNSKGETKLHMACRNGKDDEVRKLLDVDGIDVNIQDNAGWAPLHEACAKGHFKCVKLLLDWSPMGNSNERVKLMLKSMDGITPLHDAVRFNHLEIADLLLEQGGRRLLERCTKQGYTPSDLAASTEMEELLTLAQQYPCKELAEEHEVIELSSDSDVEENSSDVNVYQYLFLIYHMLVSYLTVYRIDEMFENLKKILKEEDGPTQSENKSYANGPHNYNMQIISRAVNNVLNNNKSKNTPELDIRKNDLCLALSISGTIDILLKHMRRISLEGNVKTICNALEFLGLKYNL